MSQYNRLNFRENVRAKQVYGGLFESIYYETKPFLMLGIAAYCGQNHYANGSLAKFSIGLLFAAGAYIIYRRLVHRGYLK